MCFLWTQAPSLTVFPRQTSNLCSVAVLSPLWALNLFGGKPCLLNALGSVLQPCLQLWFLRTLHLQCRWLFSSSVFVHIYFYSYLDSVAQPLGLLECSFIMSRGTDTACYCDLVWDCVLLLRSLSASVSLGSWVTPVSSLVSGTWYKNMVRLSSFSLLTLRLEIF